MAAKQEKVSQLYTSEQIARRIEELADEIAETLPRDLTLVGLLKGSFMFVADLTRALDRRGFKPKLEFLQVSSYGLEKASSGRVKVIGGMPGAIDGQPVLLVDDIQDTGRTLQFTVDLLRQNGAGQVWTCTLLDKPSRRVVEIQPDFVGFVIEDVFVVGYGIDFAERYRHLPYIGVVS